MDSNKYERSRSEGLRKGDADATGKAAIEKIAKDPTGRRKQKPSQQN